MHSEQMRPLGRFEEPVHCYQLSSIEEERRHTYNARSGPNPSTACCHFHNLLLLLNTLQSQDSPNSRSRDVQLPKFICLHNHLNRIHHPLTPSEPSAISQT
jgi:hypothetical protein